MQEREVGGIAVAHVDRDPRLLGKLLEERADEVLAAAGVDRERVAIAAAAGRDGGQGGRQGDE